MSGLARRLMLGLVLLAGVVGQALAEEAAMPRVAATYFHRTLRCQTCLQIEALSRYDVTQVLADEVAGGELSWRKVNFEEEGSTHFIEQFSLEGPSLVISLECGDRIIRWERLDRVWDLHDDVQAFDRYVLGSIEDFLVAASESRTSTTPCESP